MSLPVVLSYGGGTQTVAMCLLVAQGRLPRPDRVVFADTGREVASTAAYRDEFVAPLLREVGLEIETAPHVLAAVDLHAHNGDLLLPAFTATGKLRTWCSNEWKAYVIRRHLRATGVPAATCWIGFSLDERRRVKGGKPEPSWPRVYPLINLALTKVDCQNLIRAQGWPLPLKSRCWMCPHQSNEEWRSLPKDELAQAIVLDDEIREADERGGLFLHHSRRPLSEVDLGEQDRRIPEGAQCGFGGCWT